MTPTGDGDTPSLSLAEALWLTVLAQWDATRRWAHHRLGLPLARGPRLAVWHHPTYRLPTDGLPTGHGLEPRRADLAYWALVNAGLHRRLDVFEPPKVSVRQLAAVHDPDWLRHLTTAEGLAPVFGLAGPPFPVDEVLSTYRHAVAGTVHATRFALAERRPTLNLLGGFHHGRPDGGAGFCPVNDIAVALAVARHDGFRGRVAVLDLDAHPPDGLAACLHDDPKAWIGSLSGSDWGALPDLVGGPVDETVLPQGADDATYLAALSALLKRMPTSDLVFVLAGGDVLAGDRFGELGLSEDGALARDKAVFQAIKHLPSVWVPAGGYHRDGWRVLANTARVLLQADGRPLSRRDPLSVRFMHQGAELTAEDLGGELLSGDDLDGMFSPFDDGERLLGFYTAEGVEVALHHYGMLQELRRLGYHRFRVELDAIGAGDRLRVFGKGQGQEHLLVEFAVSRDRLQDQPVLVVQWLTLRHPLGHFTPERPLLPGQEVPGLGLAREATTLIWRMAERLELAAMCLRPAWYHVAYASRTAFQFVGLDEQAHFVALRRDLKHLPLRDLSQAVADGRVRCNGEAWAWPAALMVCWLDGEARLDEDAVQTAAADLTFDLAPPEPAP